MIKFRKLLLTFVFSTTLSVFGVAQKKVSLLIAEYDEKSADNNILYLVKYVFSDGIMTAKEQVAALPMQTEGVKGNYVRFDIGKNKIYRNRYIITGVGNIIDVKTKRVLLDIQAPFVAFSGDSIIFYTNDIFKGKYYSVYNLKTEKYSKVEDANYNPYRTPEVEADIISPPFTINYYDIKGKKSVVVNDAGYGEALPITGGKIKRQLPLFWIDKKNFIYANFDKSQKNASIYKVNINQTAEKIVTIDSIPLSASNTFFEYNTLGNIVYSCGKGRYILDLKNNKANKISFENLGNAFMIESVENKNYGRIIKFEDIEIGKKWCRYDNAQTTNGYIAVENDLVMQGERYFQGVIVWNSTFLKWTTLKIFELSSIIGWMTEE